MFTRFSALLVPDLALPTLIYRMHYNAMINSALH